MTKTTLFVVFNLVVSFIYTVADILGSFILGGVAALSFSQGSSILKKSVAVRRLLMQCFFLNAIIFVGCIAARQYLLKPTINLFLDTKAVFLHKTDMVIFPDDALTDFAKPFVDEKNQLNTFPRFVQLPMNLSAQMKNYQIIPAKMINQIINKIDDQNGKEIKSTSISILPKDSPIESNIKKEGKKERKKRKGKRKINRQSKKKEEQSNDYNSIFLDKNNQIYNQNEVCYTREKKEKKTNTSHHFIQKNKMDASTDAVTDASTGASTGASTDNKKQTQKENVNKNEYNQIDIANQIIKYLLDTFYSFFLIYPVYIMSFILNRVWYQDLAATVDNLLSKNKTFSKEEQMSNVVIRAIHKKIEKGKGQGKGQRIEEIENIENTENTEKKDKQSIIAKLVITIGEELYRTLLGVSFMLQITLLDAIPYIGAPLSLLHLAWLYGLCSFEYKWLINGWKLDRRISEIEYNFAYYAGFGTPAALITKIFPPLIDYGVFACFFPMFVVMAIFASKRKKMTTTPRKAFPIFWISRCFNGVIIKVLNFSFATIYHMLCITIRTVYSLYLKLKKPLP